MDEISLDTRKVKLLENLTASGIDAKKANEIVDAAFPDVVPETPSKKRRVEDGAEAQMQSMIQVAQFEPFVRH